MSRKNLTKDNGEEDEELANRIVTALDRFTSTLPSIHLLAANRRWVRQYL